MEKYICLHRLMENDGIIGGYFLRSITNSKEITVKPDELKNAIRTNQVEVFNLTLTKDNRLIMTNKSPIEMQNYIKEQLQDKDRGTGFSHFMALNSSQNAYFDNEVDKIIEQGFKNVLKNVSKYVRVKEFNSKNNLIVLQFRKVCDVFVMLRYQKKINGVERDGSEVHFDIGFELLGLQYNGQSLPFSNCNPLLASQIISSKNLTDYSSKFYNGTSLCLKTVRKGKDLSDNIAIINDSAYKEKFGNVIAKELMNYIHNSMTEMASGRSDLTVNTDVFNYGDSKTAFSTVDFILKKIKND